LGPTLKSVEWPTLDGSFLRNGQTTRELDAEAEEDVTTDAALVTFWEDVRTRHQARSFLSPDGPSYDLSVLPKTWAIISISVTEDRNTMFISRHQNGHDPLVFCLPLDRQSKREGEEEDVFTFDAGIIELKEIIRLSEECSAAGAGVNTTEGKAAWWATKRALDERLKQMIDNVEFCWLGAFKVGLFRSSMLHRRADGERRYSVLGNQSLLSDWSCLEAKLKKSSISLYSDLRMTRKNTVKCI
jgi:separase